MTDFRHLLAEANWIAGKWSNSGTSRFITVFHKWTQQPLAQIPLATPKQMEEVIVASETAFEEFRQWSAQDRARILHQLADLLEKEEEPFASLICAEAGKPISYARGEVARCLVTLRTAAAETLRFDGEKVPMDFAAGVGKTAFTRRFPKGPIACISPFNFPLNLALHKIAPALATGCSVILKPSPYAPLSSLAFAKLVEQTDLPAGALNVLLCDIPEAEHWIKDERMKVLSFTGSPAIGWMLKAKAGKKPVILELGGNAAVIVDETADLAHTAKRCALGAFLYAGQICISTQRIYVEQSVFKQFQELLVKETRALLSGDPSGEKITNGPLIHQVHLKRISDWVDHAVEQGAKVLAGGSVLDEERNLYAPTLLTQTQPHMEVVREEAFGPVAILEPYEHFSEAITTVNDSKFGLQAGVFTQRIDRMQEAHAKLEVGAVIVNEVPGFRVDSMPYGGVKESGLGREGIRYTMEDYTEPRLLVF
ncbi:aldehyde dehydrogenase family protein [Pontibacter sp. G13]|uniref:aldehyde dehydrogenase family protein n=1 Tax=Pontibacter sp. G13 TaxID=3074898 RepID=UPI00288B5748|nr:aldehyde dehydrogenase family protein [Pontibacter sp. G13]WNJ18474.1 aldehyde dehydrogenase family protein [Pontibacter sp. G13]